MWSRFEDYTGEAPLSLVRCFLFSIPMANTTQRHTGPSQGWGASDSVMPSLRGLSARLGTGGRHREGQERMRKEDGITQTARGRSVRNSKRYL